MRLDPVPVYVSPLKVVGCTVAAAAGVVGIFYVSFTVASKALYAALHNDPRYGHRPQEKP